MRLNKQQAEWLIKNEEVGFAIFKDGYKEGSKMRWPEMIFWMALIAFLMNLAVGGV